MTKFTKGKWEAMSDGTIALLNRRGEPGDIIATADSIERDNNEMLANARLIAAAPEMFELLKSFCDEVEAFVSIYDNFPDEFTKIAERAQEIFESIDEELEDD